MNNMTKGQGQARDLYFPFSIGLDQMFNRLSAISRENSSENFPPYNIIKDGTKTIVELALAGYGKDHIDVMVEDGILSVTGIKADEERSDGHIHRGIARRNFVRKFTLGEHVEVNSAKLENGLLTVELEEIIPPEKQPKRISIT